MSYKNGSEGFLFKDYMVLWDTLNTQLYQTNHKLNQNIHGVDQNNNNNKQKHEKQQQNKQANSI